MVGIFAFRLMGNFTFHSPFAPAPYSLGNFAFHPLGNSGYRFQHFLISFFSHPATIGKKESEAYSQIHSDESNVRLSCNFVPAFSPGWRVSCITSTLIYLL
jgi:hypothetical protein